MAHDDSLLRPETHALDALIKATVQRAKNQPVLDTAEQSDTTDTLLFMGNWHQAIPALVIMDPVLEPVDKLVWMVIMLHARETGGRTAFPSYDALASKTNVSSTSTIARAIAILRLTRWLTLCARVRQKSGQFKGNVYILHDEPLPLLDALYLDEEYLRFVEQSIAHYHARVRTVAKAVSDSLNCDIHSGQDLSRVESPLERRVQAVAALKTPITQPVTTGRYFAFTTSAIHSLNNATSPKKKPLVDQNQKSKLAEKSHYSSGCSSYYKKTTTTTTTTNSTPLSPNKVPCQPETAALESLAPSVSSASSIPLNPLVYPPRLSANQLVLAERYLAMVAPEDRQLVLDELQGRLASEQKGMKPVYDELRFLHSLCEAVKQGTFVSNLGIKVAEARLERTHPAAMAEAAKHTGSSVEDKQRLQTLGREQLAMLRQSLGMNTDS